MTNERNDSSFAPAAIYLCGHCSTRWRGERTQKPVPCPRCGRYSKVGVDSETARYFDARDRGTRGAKT